MLKTFKMNSFIYFQIAPPFFFFGLKGATFTSAFIYANHFIYVFDLYKFIYDYYFWARPGFREVTQMQIIQVVMLMQGRKKYLPLPILIFLAGVSKLTNKKNKTKVY